MKGHIITQLHAFIPDERKMCGGRRIRKNGRFVGMKKLIAGEPSKEEVT